ncbi:Do family serine endopeptidase [Hyphomicrobium sp. CS1BSMeth3]|uniref:Do family serine endopeptidase n=1 Tax=Hyphomicrobium sp. CS1BSMeth3 TaxID=1892844 RepID=UPI0009FA490B|nr:Do family serine endopeptidase [Hyphomicrobium sp. CS1BSMeth3]
MSEHVGQTKGPEPGPAIGRGWPVASVAVIAAVAIVAGAVRAAEQNSNTESTTSPAAVAAPGQLAQMPSFADLAEHVKPTVVSVYVSAEQMGDASVLGEQGQGENVIPPGSPFEFFFRQFGQPGLKAPPRIIQAQGSGFFISPDGYILTNYHVVDHAKSVNVKTIDGQSYPARVIGTDAKTDLAVLKVDGKAGFPSVTFAETVPRIGDWVLAVGNPFGLGGTVTAGIVSAQGRDIGSGPYDDFLQIDAPVNKGNSGGPTFNLRGQVVGVNTAIFSPSGGSVGIAFDIPADTAKAVAAQLEAKGAVTRGWMGVAVQNVTQDVADSVNLKQATGALVDQVQPGGPAAKSGLKAGDVILSIDGKVIADARDLARTVAAQDPGKSIALRIWQSGKEQTLRLTVAALPTEPTPPAQPSRQSQPNLGLWLAPAGEVEGAGAEGVVVVSIDPQGTAAEKGIQAGDVILEVGGKSVSTPRDVTTDLEAAQKNGQRAVLLRIKTATETHFVAVPIGRG